jgi:phospholipase C
MGFYTQADLPYYYGLATTFAVDDSYYSSVPAQTVPNRLYAFAATSFGHLVTSINEIPLPASGGF